jgi:hypothetical protein
MVGPASYLEVMADSPERTDSTAAPRLTADQAAAVFKRAAELDAEMKASGPGFDTADLESIGAEVGLEPEAIRRAVAEVAQPVIPRPGLLGPADRVVERIVPVGLGDAQAQVQAFFANQRYRLEQRDGNVCTWVPEPVGGSRGSVSLSGLAPIRSRVSPHGDASHVTFLVQRHSHGFPRLCIGILVTAGGVALAWSPADPAILLPMSGLCVLGTWPFEKQRRAGSSVRRDRAAIETFLDWLEHRT